MRIRSAKIEELKPKARERALSPRQLAALQREEEIRKALARLKSDEDILAIELDPSEKIPTMRAAVKKAIAAHRPGTSTWRSAAARSTSPRAGSPAAAGASRKAS